LVSKYPVPTENNGAGYYFQSTLSDYTTHTDDWQVINHYTYKNRNNNKLIISDIIIDIELFFDFVKQNEQTIDSWNFEKVFTIQYWNYLQNYYWLQNDKQDRLHQGILSMFLFLSLLYLNNSCFIIITYLNPISKSLETYSSTNNNSIKLHKMLSKTLVLVKEKKNNVSKPDSNQKIYKSITWMLKYIILTD